MRHIPARALFVLWGLTAAGSSGCLLLTSLSGLDDPQHAAPATSDDAAADGPATDGKADAATDDRDAAVEIIAHDDPGITGIAVHSDGLYYVRPQAQTLYRVAPGDFGPTARGTPLVSDGGAFQEVAVTTLDVFLALGTPFNNSCLFRVKHDGSNLETILDYCIVKSHMVSSPSAIFAVGEFGGNQAVWRVDVATALWSRLFSGLKPNQGQNLTRVAYDGANVYVSNQLASSIATVASTSALADFATGQTITDMAADSTTLYWIAQDGVVRSQPSNGPGQPPRVITTLVAPQRIAVDETSIYVTTSGLAPSSGTLVRIAKDSGEKKELATGLANPSALVVDATHVYWANLDDGRIMRVARK